MNSEFPDSELDTRLTKSLAKLPDAPIASNFTARVMQAIELEESRARHQRKSGWNWHALLPRVAVASVAVVFGGLVLHQYEISSQRHAMADSVAQVAMQP